jgi:pimeloyl-ACP methyl ester carboxylesterase
MPSLDDMEPHMTRTLRRLAIAAAAVAVLAGCATPSAPPKQIVLVHGAWMGASSWDKVAADLRSRGFVVTAVELPGHGRDDTPAAQLSMAGYIDPVAARLPAQGQAVLVGHSMAGMVISGAAEKAPERVSRLVYVAAYLPRSGESLYQLSQTDPDSRVGRYWQQADPKAYSPATLRREGIVEVFCADCSAADQQWLLDTHKAEAVPPLATPVTLTSGNFGRVPRTYVFTLKDNAVSYRLQETMLANAGGASQVVRLDTSHAPMLTQPRALADAIAAAAR